MSIIDKPFTIPKHRPIVVIGPGGGSRAIAKQFPMWGEGAPIYFWPAEGLVWYEDTRDNCPPHKKFGHMSVRDALVRVNGISEMTLKSSEDRRWNHERQLIQQFIGEMEEVCRLARDQGNPMENVDYLADRVRRRPKTSLVPQICDLDF